jgi:hypothetical protein
MHKSTPLIKTMLKEEFAELVIALYRNYTGK